MFKINYKTIRTTSITAFSVLLTFNVIHIFLSCLYFWIWTYMYLLGSSCFQQWKLFQDSSSILWVTHVYSFKEKKQQENVSTENGKLKNKGALPGLSQISGNWKPFKNNKKCFYVTLKAFCSQDIWRYLNYNTYIT